MQTAKPLFEEINQYLKLLNTDQQQAILTVVKTFAAGEQRHSKYQLLQNTIYGFASLQPNWDTYNADAVSPVAINSAITTLNFLNAEKILSGNWEVNVSPMRNGGIQFEFDSKQISVELEINLSGQKTFILFDSSRNLIETKQIVNLSQLPALLENTQYA